MEEDVTDTFDTKYSHIDPNINIPKRPDSPNQLEPKLERNFTSILMKNLKGKNNGVLWLHCDHCKFRHKLRYHMGMHMDRFYKGEPILNPYCCDICGLRVKNLTWHIRKHTDEKPFVCTVEGCDRRFLSGTELRLHMNRHLGKKNI